VHASKQAEHEKQSSVQRSTWFQRLACSSKAEASSGGNSNSNLAAGSYIYYNPGLSSLQLPGHGGAAGLSCAVRGFQ
jgi:hypothetical protein